MFSYRGACERSNEILYWNGSAHPQTTLGFFTNAQGVVVNKPVMININEAKNKGVMVL